VALSSYEAPYRLAGAGPNLVITPGGRAPKEAVASIAGALATRCRVLSWDRRNTGTAAVFADPAISEQEAWADDLAELLVALRMAPAYLAGGSAGCRVSLLAAIRHPEVVKGLILWSASGGPYGCQYLGYQYHVPYIVAAQAGGMEAVARTPFFAERIAANPANRGRLLAMDPGVFIAAMKRWNEFFYYRADTPLVGASEAGLARIACPTLIFEGNDDVHPPEVAEAIHRLVPRSTYAPSPWSREEFMDRLSGKLREPVFELYPRLAPAIVAFIDSVEAEAR
jgi:pimeloyl-ACP methyl ester carboxylesterase